MNLQTRIAKLEDYRQQRLQRVPVELLTDAELETMSRKSGYDMARLSDAELNALRDCYTDAGDWLPERYTPALAAALARVKL